MRKVTVEVFVLFQLLFTFTSLLRHYLSLVKDVRRKTHSFLPLSSSLSLSHYLSEKCLERVKERKRVRQREEDSLQLIWTNNTNSLVERGQECDLVSSLALSIPETILTFCLSLSLTFIPFLPHYFSSSVPRFSPLLH